MEKFSQILNGWCSISQYSRSGRKYGIKRDARCSGRARGLRLEQLEDRTLLSINGIGDEQDTSLLDDVTQVSPIIGMELTSESSMISLHYELPELSMNIVEETSMGSIIAEAIMPGTQQFAREGEPALPLLPLEIVVPYGSTVDSINVIVDDNIALPDSYILEEVTQSLVIDPLEDSNTNSEENVLNTEARSAIGDYGTSSGLYEVVGTQWRRGVETILVNLKPVQYSVETGTISYYTSMTLNVNLSDSAPSEQAESQVVLYRPDEIRPLEGDVENPSALATYVEPSLNESLATLGICDSVDTYQYVAITSQAIVDASTDYTINDLISYKQSHGMSATVVTLEEIYANYSGVDQQEQIRNFVLDAYNNWETDFVLLGGDSNILPYRSLWVNAGQNPSEQTIPSDLYYQCLDGNFNNDGDSYWGETNDGIGGGDVDLLAEVYVGRVPAGNDTEMANWVFKNIAYENSASEPYRLDAVMIGEHLGFGGVTEYASNSMEEIRLGTSAHGYTTAGFADDSAFTTSTLYDSSSYTWNASTLINQFNSDAHGIYNHLGHANTSSVMKLDNSTVDSSLTNDDFFFIYSQGCYPGDFPNDAIAEHFTTSTRHGAAAVVFNSRYGWGKGDSTDGFSQRPNREFWDALFSEELNQLGVMNADSHEDLLWGISEPLLRYVTYETTLFGDPAAKIVSFDLSVVNCSPAAGSTVSSTPTDFDITFSEPYLSSSIDASDLLVNGVAADSFTLVDDYNITFHYSTSPVTTQGLQSMEIAAGSVLRAADNSPVLAWSSSFHYDAHVVSVSATDPSDGSVTTIPFDYLRIDFDEPVDAGSIGVNDLTLSQGSVVSASMVDADTVEYTLTGINTEGTLTFNLAAGAVSDAWGNPGAAYSGSFTTDIATAVFPTPLVASSPLGGLIYSGTASGTIAPGTDTDGFTIDLDAGQTLTALVQSETGLQPTVTITDPGGTILGSAASSGVDMDALLQTVPVATAGTYTITVGSVGGTTSGNFTLELTLNAALEGEEHNGIENDTMATAQDITASFVRLGEGLAQRGAVTGTANGNCIDTENFEGGTTLGPQWSTYSSNSSRGRIRVTHSYGAAEGTYAMVMDVSTDSSYNLNEAIWTVDMSEAASPVLSFYHRDWGDEIHSFSGDFTGHYNADGVAISDDGITWHPVWTANSSGAWQQRTIDLAAEAAAHGLTFGANFKIKFQQYDNYALTTDGRGYDQIEITNTGGTVGGDWYRYTMDADESSTLVLTSATADMTLKLYDSGGNLLVTGNSTSNFNAVISNFVATASDTYYVSVDSENNGEYQLIVTKNADFDNGINNSLTTAQLLSASSAHDQLTAIGYLGSSMSETVVEPDDYPAGSILTDVVPGITLTTQGSSSAITSRTSSYHSTGTRAFAYGTSLDWYSDGYWLRADFSGLASSVSIDIAPDDSNDPGIMRAYNASGILLSEVTCPAPPLGSFTTLTISRPNADIAYILASGQGGETVMLDNLVVNGIGADKDYYKIQADIGKPLVITTITPAGGSGEFVNELDPKIELYDPTGTLVALDDNSAIDGRNAKLTYIPTMTGDYTVQVLPATDASGEYVLLVNASQVTLTAPADAWEGSGPVTATLDITTPLADDLVVNLTSSAPGRISVPASITIPAGQTTQTITLDVIDDSLLQGPEEITITATADHYGSSIGIVNLHDDETAVLTVSLPASATENAGVLTGAGTITVDTAPVRDVTIQLTSDDASEISVPQSVILPAGQTTVTFDITVNDDTLIDDTQTASVTASVENWTDSVSSMDVLDDDRTLAVTLPTDAWEGEDLLAGVGTVQIGGTLPTDLIVSLSSDDTGELQVPTTVTILAGQTSAAFDVTILDDPDWDGIQMATITASAPGFADDGVASVAVHDNELDHFTFGVISSPQTASVPFAAEIYAKNIDDETILVYGETVNLTGEGDSGSVPIVPGSCIFDTGVWTGNVTVDAVESGVLLTINNGAGGTGQSNEFDVVPGPMTDLRLSTVPSPQYENAPFSLTVTAVDANGYTVTDCNATVDITGLVGRRTASSIVVSEIEVGANDRMEFANVSGNDLDIGGWTIWAYDSAYPSSPQQLLTIPDDTVCPAGGLFVLEEFGTTPGVFPNYYSGTNLNWTPLAQTGVLVLDRVGNVMDFVAASSLDPATISTPVTLVPDLWQGAQVAAVDSESWSYQRVGSTEHNDASDWVIDRSPNVGTLNAGMASSFTGGTVTLTPTTFTLVDGVCTDTITVMQTVHDMTLRADDGNGHICDSNTFDVLSPSVVLSIPADATEGDGTIEGTLTISIAQDTDVVVYLASSNPDRMNVPAEVIIPAGQTTVTISLEVVDNALLDGPQDVVVTAMATGYVTGTAPIGIHDNETAVLTVSLPSNATEGDGVLIGAGTVSSSAAPTQDMVVHLVSSNTNEVLVPATVILPAGQTEVAFDVTIVDDTLIDDTQTATISATVENWPEGSTTIDVLDNDRTLAVTLPGDTWEGESFENCTIEIGGTLSTDLVVSLSSDDSSELQVPATVTIPAGQTTATFIATIMTDGDRDGVQTPTFTATAGGFSDATTPIVVHDADLDHFQWSVVDGPQMDAVPFAVMTSAMNIDGETIVVHNATASISATGDSGSLPISPTTCVLASGVWTGNVTIDAVDTNVTLTMDDGAGNTGISNAFEVMPGHVASFEWSTITSPQYENVSVSATLTAKDVNGYTVTHFNDTVDLSGWTGGGTNSTIVISEVEQYGDAVEFTNVSGVDIDISGWRMVIYDEDSWTSPKFNIAISNGTICPAGSLFVIREDGSSPGSYPNYWTGSNIDWGYKTAAMLLDNTGQIVDFMCADQLTASSIVSPMRIPTEQWQGSQTPGASSGYSIQRTGDVDHNDKSDWLITNKNIGSLNPNLTIPFTGGRTSVSISPVTAGFVDGVWTGNIKVLEEATEMYLSMDYEGGLTADSNTFNVLPLTVKLDIPTDADENVGTVAATISLPTTLGEDLVIDLVSSNPGRITVPTSVTILAGQNSASVPLTVVDNALLDGAEAITITATLGSTTDSGTLTVHDDETAVLTVSLPSDATEGDGTLSGMGTITASAAPTRDIVVTLTSSDTDEATVPATVVLPAGQTTVAFDVTIVDDTQIDDTQTPSVTATVENWTDGSATMNVLDNDRTLTVTLPTEAWEGEGLMAQAGEVQIGGTLSTDLIISLNSDNHDELLLPATVTIPAGQTSTRFDVTIVDDTISDGLQTATVTASHGDFSDVNGEVAVHDNELDHFVWDTISSPQTAGVSSSVTAYAKNIDNEDILVYNETATLAATGDSGAVPVNPGSCTFVSGIWNGSVAIDAVDKNVVLTIDDGLGHMADTNTFDVVAGPVAGFEWSTVATTQYVNLPFPATLTAVDANGYTVTDFNDTVDLSGWTGDGEASHSIFDNPSPTRSSSGNYTIGYSFTPNADILVTHFSHYFGNKVSLWTDNGTLLASASYTNTPGTWSETLLATPVQLHAGTTYKVGTYTGSSSGKYYWRSDVINTFPDGTINQGIYATGDAFPNKTDGTTYWFVGLRYNVGSMSSVSIAPTSATFSDGSWTGDIIVLEEAAEMYLQMDDGSGHKDVSNTFDVLPVPIDFGDAPSPYPTLAADGGAGHVMVSGFHLGSVIDAEADGQPSADATLDDTTGTPNDEDGVVFSDPLYLGTDATIEVTASAAGRLDAWIDFNNDGDWDDAGEKIFDNVSLTAGTNALSVTVPVTATLSDQTFARFRLSTAGGLSYIGMAADGEVEDYAVAIQLAPPTLDSEPFSTPGTENTITWSAVPGADAYYVECDDDADFSSPEANSGWVADTSYTFVGLTADETYYYRVKSRAETVAGGTGNWAQTTQADFTGDTLDNTNITSQPGDVVLEGSPVGSVVDVLWDITHGVTTNHEPSGEYSSLTGLLTNCGYTVTTTSTSIASIDLSSYEVIVVNIASAWYTPYTTAEVAAIEAFVQNGGGLLIQGDNPSCPNANVNPVSQAFGSTIGASSLSPYDITSFNAHPITTGISHLYAPACGSVTVVSPSNLVAYISGSGAVSVAEVGTGHAVFIGDLNLWTNRNFDRNDNSQFAENVFEWLSEDTGYTSPGNLVSTSITPSLWENWGTLTFNDTTPTGTTLTVDILPATGTTPIPGYENVASGVDISGITDTEIRLRANLATTDPSVTPALHDWSVTWQEANIYTESVWSTPEFSKQLPSLLGDANCDGKVDGSDTTILAANWQLTGKTWSDGDFNGDGIVDGSDVTILSAHWQETLSLSTASSSGEVGSLAAVSSQASMEEQVIDEAAIHDAVFVEEYGQEPKRLRLDSQDPAWSYLAVQHQEMGPKLRSEFKRTAHVRAVDLLLMDPEL